MTGRRLAGAIGVLVAYVALAAISGWLSPLARRPVLDGLGPLAPYRWVSPPPELASSNVAPAAGDFEIALSPTGSEAVVFVTTDNQVTVLIDDGTLGPHADDRSVRLRVTPVDPATLGELPSELVAFGNALQIRATYEPSGARVRTFAKPLRIVVIYPVTADLHASKHELRFSPDGNEWSPIESSDSVGLQQVEGSIPQPGLAVVAGELTPNPITPFPPDSGPSPLAIVLLIASTGTFVAGAAILVRARRAK